jgi:hypothetical protein
LHLQTLYCFAGIDFFQIQLAWNVKGQCCKADDTVMFIKIGSYVKHHVSYRKALAVPAGYGTFPGLEIDERQKYVANVLWYAVQLSNFVKWGSNPSSGLANKVWSFGNRDNH